MRTLFLFFTTLLAVKAAAQPVGLPVEAAAATVQAGLPAAPPAPAQLLARPDTAAAIHRLFAHKRHQSGNFLALSLGGGAVGVAAASQLVWSRNQTESGVGIASFGLAAYVALPVAIVEVVRLVRFNRRHEQQALEQFSAHRLPPYLRKKLKAKYFQSGGAGALSPAQPQVGPEPQRLQPA